tara:strand:- start:178 stop:438 length:261 start_codon:yes stop_codon:yes gene_type:complete
MKFLLTIFLCSTVANTCLTPHTFTQTYVDSYDCLMDGYVKSIEKMEEIGREEINKHGIYLKFDCQPYILPEKKPIGQPVLLRLYTN